MIIQIIQNIRNIENYLQLFPDYKNAEDFQFNESIKRLLISIEDLTEDFILSVEYEAKKQNANFAERVREYKRTINSLATAEALKSIIEEVNILICGTNDRTTSQEVIRLVKEASENLASFIKNPKSQIIAMQRNPLWQEQLLLCQEGA